MSDAGGGKHHTETHFGPIPTADVAFVEHPSPVFNDERIIRKPRLRQYFTKDQTFVRESTERKTSWNELFYDLIFVVSLNSISHEHLLKKPGWAYPVLFFTIFRCWSDTTHFLNKFDTGDQIYKLFVLFEMCGVIGMSINVDVWNPMVAHAFAGSYLITKGILILMFIWVLIFVKEARKNLAWSIIASTIPVVFFVASLFVSNPRVCLILWAVSLVVELAAVFTTAYLPKLFVPLNIEHITERFGLFMLIILGEDIANMVFLEKGQFHWQDYLVVFMALTQTFAFQLLYYDIEETHHHRKKHAFRRRKQTGQTWVILHLIYALAVPILAIGISLLLDIVKPPGAAPVAASGGHKRAAVEPPSYDAPHDESPHAYEPYASPVASSSSDYLVMDESIKPLIMKWFFAGGFAGAYVSLALIGLLHQWDWKTERIPKPARVIIRVACGLAPIPIALLTDDLVLMVGITTILMVSNCVMELFGGRHRPAIPTSLPKDFSSMDEMSLGSPVGSPVGSPTVLSPAASPSWNLKRSIDNPLPRRHSMDFLA